MENCKIEISHEIILRITANMTAVINVPHSAHLIAMGTVRLNDVAVTQWLRIDD